MKKRGFGAGRWNGFGGKVEEGESVEEAARRELLEESGIRANSINKLGIIDFKFLENPEILEVHLFKVDSFEGDVRETEEMSPKWFFVDEIPFSEMWPDDRYWFPYFIRGQRIRAGFTFGKNDAILDYKITGVEDI